MPVYTIELDGKQYDLEGDHAPSEAEARAAIGGQSQPKAAPPPPSATIGMLAQSTPTSDPKVPHTLMDLVDEPAARQRDADRIDKSLSFAIPTPAVSEVATAVKGVPGILARGLGISKARAGQNIEQALQAAKDVGGIDVDLSKAANSGLRAVELKAAKFYAPNAVTGLVERVTKPGAASVGAQEAHDLASNLGNMSANELGKVKGAMKPVVAKMAGETRQALVDALNAIDKGDLYKSGVNEYARASRAAKAAKWAAAATGATGAVTGGLSWLKRQLGDALSGH